MFAEIIIPSCFIRNSEYSIQYQEENLKMGPGFWILDSGYWIPNKERAPN
jgi:hypothetical protein